MPKIDLKKHLSFSNLFFLSVMAFLLYSKYPQIKQNFESEGKTLEQKFILTDLRTQNEIKFPLNKKHVVVFWATWCGPCKLELGRLQDYAEKNKAAQDLILAVSVDENINDLNNYLKTTPYSFLTVHDAEGLMARSFNVIGTPTLLFVDEKDVVQWRSTGISPSLKLRVSNFLGI